MIEFSLPVLDYVPQRIVSLVPSLTETVFAFDCGHRVVGRTKFCIHPKPDINHINRVGGTKNVRLLDVLALRPDLILANKEENVQEQIEVLSNDAPVYFTDIKNTSDALAMITDLGGLLDKRFVAEDMVARIRSQMEILSPTRTKTTILYLIWKDPYMTVGSDTFIYDMLCTGGFTPVDLGPRYPVVDIKAVINSVDAVMLSSEPYPFKVSDAQSLEDEWGIPVICVDGELVSWYGSRMLTAFDYLQQLHARLSF